MHQYTYKIYMYGDLGEIFDETGKWYNNLQYCENILIHRVNGNKFREEMIENDVDCNCFVDIYIINNERLNNIDSEKYSTIYFQSKYRIIKLIKKIIYDPYSGFSNRINIKDLLYLNKIC